MAVIAYELKSACRFVSLVCLILVNVFESSKRTAAAKNAWAPDLVKFYENMMLKLIDNQLNES